MSNTYTNGLEYALNEGSDDAINNYLEVVTNKNFRIHINEIISKAKNESLATEKLAAIEMIIHAKTINGTN